ncbi:MAG: DinB family protein [Bryobacterales bacterium]|nr:DinB family protein [Bryobacterales bacterium]
MEILQQSLPLRRFCRSRALKIETLSQIRVEASDSNAHIQYLEVMGSTVTTTELIQQIDAIVARKDALIAGLNSEQMSWRPQVGRWSILECLDHLNRSDIMYLRGMRVVFERERQNASLPPKAFRLGFLARQILHYLEPPPRLKMPAPRSVFPPEGLVPAGVVAEFNRFHLDLRGFVLDASGVDMGAIRFPSPMSSLLKLNLAEGCAIIAGHDRRHLWQAEQVRKHTHFPVSDSPGQADVGAASP